MNDNSDDFTDFQEIKQQNVSKQVQNDRMDLKQFNKEVDLLGEDVAGV